MTVWWVEEVTRSAGRGISAVAHRLAPAAGNFRLEKEKEEEGGVRRRRRAVQLVARTNLGWPQIRVAAETVADIWPSPGAVMAAAILIGTAPRLPPTALTVPHATGLERPRYRHSALRCVMQLSSSVHCKAAADQQFAAATAIATS